MTRNRLESLASPVLIVAVAVLGVNDWVLKPAFHNALTGKLSDVAGVAAFALFWAALFPRHRRRAFVATAVGFVLWKSPASQPLIDAWNGLGWGTIGRVVDWTDLLALAVLPLIYRYDPRPLAMPRLRRVLGPAVAAACVLAFGATSQVRLAAIPLEGEYAFDIPPDTVLRRMYDLRAGYNPRDIPPGTMQVSGVDTLHLTVGARYVGERQPVTIRAELARTAQGGSVLRLLDGHAFSSHFIPQEALRSLEEQVVEPLRRNLPNRVHLEPQLIGNQAEIQPRILAPAELFSPRAEVRVSIARPSYLAVVEVTPWMDWKVIYPVDRDDMRLFPAGEHTLATLCARTRPGTPVAPGAEVAPCAVARPMTLADADRLRRQTVPDPCHDDAYKYPIERIRPGALLLIAADGLLPRAVLEETLGTWCQAYPGFAEAELARVLRRMDIHHWAAVEQTLRR
ncbi:MAG TPA: hypothetical protein VFT45_25960 [Longimicrobium sp.]|nr:hypothetical protein [Longimicrobium sp.]